MSLGPDELAGHSNGLPDRETAGERRSYWLLRSTQWLAPRVPRTAGLWAVAAYQRLAFERFERQRRIVAENLSRVLAHPPASPLVQRATREAFGLYGRYWYETFALRGMPFTEVNRRFELVGREHIDGALAGGRGMILTLPHMGNWDAAGHWLSAQGYRMTAVAERLRAPRAFDLFLRHRRALGMGIVPLGDRRVLGQRLIRLLGENEIIALVADRNLSGRGIEVRMFDGERKLPAGPALLSLATGAPLLVAAVFTTEEGWRCEVNPPLEVEKTGDMRRDVATLMHRVASGFERAIAAAPADWHMFQPAW